MGDQNTLIFDINMAVDQAVERALSIRIVNEDDRYKLHNAIVNAFEPVLIRHGLVQGARAEDSTLA